MRTDGHTDTLHGDYTTCSKRFGYGRQNVHLVTQTPKIYCMSNYLLTKMENTAKYMPRTHRTLCHKRTRSALNPLISPVNVVHREQFWYQSKGHMPLPTTYVSDIFVRSVGYILRVTYLLMRRKCFAWWGRPARVDRPTWRDWSTCINCQVNGSRSFQLMVHIHSSYTPLIVLCATSSTTAWLISRATTSSIVREFTAIEWCHAGRHVTLRRHHEQLT